MTRGLLTLTIRDGRHQWGFTGPTLTGSAPRFSTPLLETRTRGDLTIAFVLRDGTAEVSSGDVTMPLRPDWGYNVTVGVYASDPTEGCLGCLGKTQFTLAQTHRSSPADAVWIYWSGNSIKHPVVY